MDKKSKFAFEQMEPRLLFSADLDGGLVSGAPLSHTALLDPAMTQELVPSSGVDGETRSSSEIRQELVIVDTDTPDYQQLIDDLLANQDETRHLEVILLDNTRDGIHQVTEILSNYQDLDAVHLISHGSDGAVDLGGSTLGFDSLKANANLIKSWSEAFSADGDLLIYGCNLAASEAGQSLVNALGRLTGADVAASDDLTGSAALGADWELEYRTGLVETEVAVSQEARENWSNVMVTTYTVTTNAATGPGSLDEAITLANAAPNSGGPDRIHFNIGGGGQQTITVAAGGLPAISDAVILDATTQPGFSGTPIIELNGTSAGAGTEGLRITGDGVTVRGLVINRFQGHGIEIFGDNNRIELSYIGTDVSGTVDQGNWQLGIRINNATGNYIGGAGVGNVISGNGFAGIAIVGSTSSNNFIQGNLIGTDAGGTFAIKNDDYGIDIWSGGPDNNTVGGTTVDLRNVISGNGWAGVHISGGSGNTVAGNYIGTDITGTVGITNGSDGNNGGIDLDNGATSNTIGGTADGAGNLIAFNTGPGVKVDGATTVGNAIQENEIHSNTGIGIDHRSGSNQNRQTPVISSVTTDGVGSVTITGNYSDGALGADTLTIEFFSNPVNDREGRTYLGSDTLVTDASGNAVISSGISATLAAGQYVTATVTDSSGNTSEFALNAVASSSVVLTAAGDTWIDKGVSGTNYGDSTSLVIDHGGGGIGDQRALLQFDLSTIPAGATITGATLQMQATSNTGAFNINVYELTESWVEGSGIGSPDAANWNERQAGVNWSTAGGTFDPTVVATLNTGATGQHNWDLTTLVQAWYGGSKVNNGIIFGSQDGGSHTVTYDSSEGTTPPELEIYYVSANSPPMIGGVETGAVTEDADPDLDSLLETGAALTISDADAGEDSFIAGTITGTYGDLTIDAAGNWAYAADNTQAAIQNLPAGATLTDTITVTTVDGTTHDVIITITGANDAPVIGGADTGAVTEDVDPDLDGLLETSGAMTITDVDTGEANFTAGTVAGTYGLVTINAAGNWTYAADNTEAAIQNLAAGATLTDTLTVTSADSTTHDVVITITGANDAPVIVTNTALNVPEEATRTITTAELLATDVDNTASEIVYTVTGLPTGGSVRLNASALGLGGTFTQDDIDNGRVSYSDSDDGESTSFLFTVSDGTSTSGNIIFSINGTPINDAPVVMAPGASLNATEQVDLAIAGQGFSVSDVDDAGGGASATLSVGEGIITVASGDSGVLVTGGNGSGNVTLSGSIVQINKLLTGAGTGTITYLNNSDNPAPSTVFTVTVNDQGNTGTDPGLSGDASSEEGTNTVTINITADNDTPTIGGVDTGAVTEDVDPDLDGLLETGGALTISDPDTGESSFTAGTVTGIYGDLNIDTAGNWTYAADNTQAAIQALDAGESINDTLTVTTADGTTHDVVITINGAEDTPVIGGIATGSVTEDGMLTTSNTLAITDVDTSDNPISFNDVAPTPGTSGYGNFEITGNTWTYTLNNALAAVQALDAGETLNDSYTFTATGGSTRVVTVTINGAEDAPVIGGTSTGTVSEDGTLTASNTLTITDVDTSDNPISFNDVVPTLGTNGYGNFVITGNTWTYTLNNAHAAVQALDIGETLNDTYTFTASDGSTRVVTITINGAEDAAVIGGMDTGAVTEDVAVTAGNLMATGALTLADIDTSDNPVSFNAGTIIGTFGDLTIDDAGNWSYNALNSQAPIQSLAAGATLTDILTVTSTDGTTHAVVVVITGTNDAPTVANPNPDQLATVDALFSFTFALNTFADVDGDNLTFTATLGDNSPLPGWLSFDAVTRTLSGTPTSADTGLIVLKITADDGQGGTVSDVFNLQVNATPGGPVVIIEAPDPGPTIEPAPDPEVIDPPTGTTDPNPGDGKEDPSKDSDLPSFGGEVTPVPESGAGDPVPPGEPAPEVAGPDEADAGAAEPEQVIAAEPGAQVKQFDTPADFKYGRAGMTAKALMRVSAFVQELDEARQVMNETATIEQRIVGTTMTVTTGLSVGYVIWLIRGGVLLSSVLSSLPAWRLIDPLPVLAFTGRCSEDEEDDDSLESLVTKGNRAKGPRRGAAGDGEGHQE